MKQEMEPLSLTCLTTVNALGHGLEATARALNEERTGLVPCNFAGWTLPTFVGRVAEVEESPVLGALAEFDCRNNRLAQMALEADGFAERVAEAAARYGPDRIAVIIGTTTSGVRAAEEAFAARGADGRLPQDFIYDGTVDHFSVSDFVARYLRLAGPAFSVSTACSSSSNVFVDAWQLIGADLCDAAVVGGVDSLCLMALRGFGSLELLSAKPCRPNDTKRDGISLGEAAGFALVERRESCPSSVASLLGYGASCDAFHMSAPDPNGTGAELCMRAALKCAGLQPDQIDYVNLHGTGTPMNDSTEDQAVHRIFGNDVPCSSIKGWTGHTLGAAGITNVVVSALCIRDGFLPKNLNLEAPDPALLCRILECSERRPVRRVLTNSFGFGGSNCSLILGAPE